MRSFNRLKYLLYFGLLAVAYGGVVAPTCTASGKCPNNYCCLRDPWWDDVNKACAPLSKVDSEHNPATPLWPSCCYREVQGRHQRPACIVKCYVSNNERPAEYRSSVYNNACPCEQGYVCRGLHDFSLKGICVKECSLNTDCPGDRCCATESLPGTRGKRSQGICRQLGTANETCFVEDKINDVVNVLCPCASGFYCQGNGAVDGLFPTKDRGVCVPVDTNDKIAIPGK